MMTKMPERISFWGGLLQLVMALLLWATGSWSQSRAVTAEAAYLFLGCAFWFFTYIHCRQQRLAADERKEEAELARKYHGDDTKSIFGGKERIADQFSAVVQLGKIERILLPFFVLLLGAAYIAICFFILGGKFAAYAGPVEENFLVASLFVALLAFVSFLYSKYVMGISVRKEFGNLKTPAMVMLSGSFFSLVVTVTLLVVHLGYARLDLVIGKAIPIIMALVGAELAINFIISLYRPFGRRKGENPVYYSRVVAMLTGPRNIFKATASTLDYQFGFKVSETWFYQFLERAAAPLFLFLILSLYLLSTVVVVQPHQRVIIERFGKPQRQGEVFGPGLHFKMPWPVDIAHTFDVDRVQTIVIGHHDENEENAEVDDGHGHGGEGPHKGATILWTEKHAVHEYTILVATQSMADEDDREGVVSANLLALAFNINFRIRDDAKEIYKFAYNSAAPRQVLKHIASRELTRYAVSADYENMLGEGRKEISETLLERIQRRADENELGVEITFAGLAGVHPPVEIAAAYEAVIGAGEEKKSKIFLARAEAAKISNLAQSEKATIINKDRGLAYRKKEITRAEAIAFKSWIKAYQAAPEVFFSWIYLDTLTDGISDKRKYIYPASKNFKAIFNIDLEIKKSPSILSGINNETEEEK
jgi:regulator of protease activity HflC (stomatin/prohibitin superfamily)